MIISLCAVAFGIALIFVVHKTMKSIGEDRDQQINSRLSQLDLEHIAGLYTPQCDFCNNRGWIERKTGAMVHVTTRENCTCRTMQNWLLALIDKWIEEGDVQHAAELLLILREKV